MKKSFQTNSVRLLNSEHIDRGNINCLDAVGFQPCHKPLILLFISSVGVFIMYMRQLNTPLTCTNSPRYLTSTAEWHLDKQLMGSSAVFAVYSSCLWL